MVRRQPLLPGDQHIALCVPGRRLRHAADHTAEQLTLLDEDRNLLPDPDLQWRHYTRNLVGDNRGTGSLDLLREPDSSANTSHELEGHHYHGAGFSVSANQNGCFPFAHDGEIYFFDLSLSDAPRDPSLPPISGDL